MEALEIKKFIGIAKRRVYWAIIPFLIVLLGGLGFGLQAEPVYQAQTLILVQPQEVPQEYVRSIVRRGIEERLRTISQQVTSRTNLESIISDRRLYEGTGMLMESKVQTLRNNIQVNVGGGTRGQGESTFRISFRHRDPEVARDVTSALTSNFISENLRVRESQALGTSSFLADELDAVRRRLEEREGALKEYRERYFGAMPEQLQTNLSMLMSMQSQIENLEKTLQDSQHRRLLIQDQIAQQKRMAEELAEYRRSQGLADASDGDDASGVRKLAALKAQLEDFQVRYTESHPDVRRLKNMIESLETQEAEAIESLQTGETAETKAGISTPETSPPAARPWEALERQLVQVDFEIGRIRADIAKSKERLEMYQKRVEETPKREQEVRLLKRDYENLKQLYNSLLNRKLEAEIAVSMEKKQKGEQFRILDSAKRPEIPVEPDFRRIFLMTIALALGFGGGVAYLREISDTSYKEPTEAVEDLGLPILVTLPFSYTQKEERILKIKRRLQAAGVVVGFVILAAGIVVFTKGLDRTVAFLMRNLPFLGST